MCRGSAVKSSAQFGCISWISDATAYSNHLPHAHTQLRREKNMWHKRTSWNECWLNLCRICIVLILTLNFEVYWTWGQISLQTLTNSKQQAFFISAGGCLFVRANITPVSLEHTSHTISSSVWTEKNTSDLHYYKHADAFIWHANDGLCSCSKLSVHLMWRSVSLSQENGTEVLCLHSLYWPFHHQSCCCCWGQRAVFYNESDLTPALFHHFYYV